MHKRMHKMMFGYKIKAMHKGCIRDVQAMCKRMHKRMFGYKIKAMCKGCTIYVHENVQDDVQV